MVGNKLVSTISTISSLISDILMSLEQLMMLWEWNIVIFPCGFFVNQWLINEEEAMFFLIRPIPVKLYGRINQY